MSAAGWRCCAATSRRAVRCIKRSAATPRLLQHEGRAVVFETWRTWRTRIDDDALEVSARRRAGAAQCRAEGRAGHAGGRLHPDPAASWRGGREGHGAHLRRAHERHRVRHHRAAHRRRNPRSAGRSRWCAPAIACGSTPRRGGSTCWWMTPNWRRAAPHGTPPPPPPGAERGYLSLFLQQVLQADEGCDFAFCRPRNELQGEKVRRSRAHSATGRQSAWRNPTAGAGAFGPTPPPRASAPDARSC